MKNTHKKKMIAPILITVILAVYYLVYFTVLVHLIGGIGTLTGKLLMIVPIVVGGLLVYVCVERIREIQGGEEDDLSQY